MKSGDRLNQIEPLIAEMLIKLDETAVKVDRVSEDVAELKVAMQKSNVIATKQSDTISFLLKNQLSFNDKLNQIDQKLDQVDQKFDQIDQKFDRIDQKFDGIDGRLDKMDNNFDEIKRRFVENENTQQEIKLIQESILTLLKNPN